MVSCPEPRLQGAGRRARGAGRGARGTGRRAGRTARASIQFPGMAGQYIRISRPVGEDGDKHSPLATGRSGQQRPAAGDWEAHRSARVGQGLPACPGISSRRWNPRLPVRRERNRFFCQRPLSRPTQGPAEHVAHGTISTHSALGRAPAKNKRRRVAWLLTAAVQVAFELPGRRAPQ